MKIFANIKHIFFIIAISLTILFGMYAFLGRDFIAPINYFFTYRTTAGAEIQDLIYKPQLAPSDNIVIVEIDEATLNNLNSQSEYSMLTIGKDEYTRLMKFLKAAGAKAVGFDIVFQNADKYEKEFAESMLDFENTTIATLKPKKTNNSLWEYTLNDCSGDGDIENLTCPFTPRGVYSKIRWGLIDGGNTRSVAVMENRDLAYPITAYGPMQTQIKFGTGNINLTTRDSFVYTLPIAMLLSEENELVKKLVNMVIKSQQSSNGGTSENTIPKLPQPYFLENRQESNAAEHPYRTISLAKILDIYKKFQEDPNEYIHEWRALQEGFSGAYVLVGESGTLIHDTVISPSTGHKIPGVYTHAFFLDGILQNKLLSELGSTTTYILSIVVTILAVLLYFFLPKFISPIVAVFAIILTIFVARYSYGEWRVVFDIFPFLLSGGIITYPIVYIYKFFIVDKGKRQILNAFSRYISPSVVEMIDTNKIAATLGGEKKELSILFSDIAGFTSISEKMDTKNLFILMTDYLSRMTDILIEHQGTLDKYIGDAVMWFFGAPADDPFHAINACRTAVHMRRALDDFNNHLKEQNLDPIDFRVGIATGEVMVGNIGSEKRFNYTVLGDTVNLASRLEWMGKEYGVNVIIAATTRILIGDEFLIRELDYISVKGKNEGVRIFEVLWLRWDSINMAKYTNYEAALRLYREGQYLAAGHIFERFATEDPPAMIMMKRCAELIKGEMMLDHGIYRMTHK